MADKANMDEKLLFELLESKEVSPAAFQTERVGIWCEWLIGIGNDDVAYITMPLESAQKLIERVLNRGIELPVEES